MEYKRLGDVINIKKGKKIEQVEESENTIRYIQIDDLRNDDNIKFCEKNDKYVMAEKEDIIIAWDGANAGTVGFGLNGAIGSTLARLDINDDEIDTIYCAMFLRSKFKYLREKCTGATIPHLSRASLEDLKLPKLSLETQKKIVEVLDKGQSLIDKKKEQIELLDELIKSRFVEMFGDLVKNSKGWEIKKLGKLGKVKSSKRVFVDELVENGIPFYRGTEVGALSTGEKIEPTLFITKEHYEALKESTGIPKIGDLLLPSICPDGRIWIVNTEEPFYFKDGRVLWIHLENNYINSIFLKYMLREKFNRDYNKIASGTTFAELKIFSLNDIDVVIPPIELQNEFAEFVTQTDTIRSKMETSLSELEDNFNSLMQKAFKGELF